MHKRKIIGLIVLALLLTPLWMWLAWQLTPKRRLTVAIVDKTVIDGHGQEHISLDWVMNQQRFAKTSTSLYRPDRDYFGFFPGKDTNFTIKGLEQFSYSQLTRLSGDADILYFTDTYGVYRQEWLRKEVDGQRSGLLYGGMTEHDIALAKEMKSGHKLIMAEFNSIGSPTAEAIRLQFENLFSIRWTGWTARYFTSLDTAANQDLPRWLIQQYRQQHQEQWPFHKDGVAWVNNEGEIVIIENGAHMTDAVPRIVASASGRRLLHLPGSVRYPFWFDVIEPCDTASGNQAEAEFVIQVNDAGSKILREHHIPQRFPAVVRHAAEDYRFYYFCGDFCDNPLTMTTSYFKGIGLFKSFFYDEEEPGERKSFFWNFYRPMMTGILEDEYRRLHQ